MGWLRASVSILLVMTTIRRSRRILAGKFIEELRIGKYTITEVEDSLSAGYKRPAPVVVELVADETLTVNVHNDKVTVDVPKTGDNFNPWIWVGLVAASTVGLGASIFWAKAQKENGRDSRVRICK